MVETIDHLTRNLDDNAELYEMSKADEDFDGLQAILDDANTLRESVEQLEFRRMFSNPADPGNCFVDIQAGAGGTEACDWAQMLLRQYLKYCERKGYKAEVMEETEGDVAGIRSATLKIEGEYAFGHLRTETGVHRLVRKSPFDSAGGRHTSFASLFVYPEVDDSIEIEINPADVRIDTFRASGAGGQHINKTAPCPPPKGSPFPRVWGSSRCEAAARAPWTSSPAPSPGTHPPGAHRPLRLRRTTSSGTHRGSTTHSSHASAPPGSVVG